ncbi:MAG: flagellar filament capping protein FliD, partial [Nitrospirota bacterium]|nr:flagellar filament capping protein FliD [Nitrospirota bacterium]
MSISGVATSGLMSGIDVNGLVQKILAVEQRPISILQSRQNDYKVKIASVLNLSAKLSSYKAALDALNNSEKFNTKTASVTKTSSGAELLTVSASNAAEAGSYDIVVNQLASASKKASQGWIDQDSTAVASAVVSFKFKVGISGAVTTIGVDSTTTLQGLRDKINTADAGVTASIINDGTGSTPYRLILTADNSGSSNTVNIVENGTSLNFVDKIIEEAYAYSENTFSGTVTSNTLGTYTGTTNKTFLIEAVSAGASETATYKYSIDGGINWLGSGGAAYTGGNAITTQTVSTAIDGTGASSEGVEVLFSPGSALAVGDRFTIDVFNPEMQTAKDAVIEIDNATIVKSTNTITDAVPGVTLNLLKEDSASTLTLTVSSSSSSAKSSIEKFVETYNGLYEYINEQMSYDTETKKSNPLLGDPAVLEIRRRIADRVTGSIPGISTASYTNLSQIGISSDYKTGKLSIDSLKLSSALSSKPDDVAKLFIGSAVPTNSS